MNIPPYGDSYKRVGAYFSNLQVSAKSTPNMTVKISAGGYWYYSATGATYVEYVGGSSPTITAPTGTGNAKWVIIAMGPSGVVSNIDGAVASNPVLPTVPGRARIPLAAIYIQTGTTTITNDMIYDVRPMFPLEVRDHRDLEGLTSTGSHPISAISNLTETIANLVTSSALTTLLADKADQDGTNDTTFTLNKDYSGAPASDCLFEVERGSGDNVGIKWHEDISKWQFTDDGTNWINFGDLFINTGTQELNMLVYSQNAEPTLTVGNVALWIDTNDSDKVYLIYSRGSADQVKVELTQ